MCVTFVTLECVRARVWLSPSLRNVAACVWPWLPERVVVVHIWLELRRLPQILLVLVRRTINILTQNSSHFTPRELVAKTAELGGIS